MTSNIGTRKLKDFGTGVGFDTDYRKKEKNKLSTEVLKRAYQIVKLINLFYY